jgi:ABC-type bacteriocin/lantibiotic exporter with double-glycine peptidase domain
MAASMRGPAAAVALAAGAAFAAAVLGGRAQAAAQRTEIQAQVRQDAFLIESLSGIETVKGMGAERHVQRRWLELLLDQFAAGLRRQRLGIWTDLVLEGTRKGLTVVVLVWGGRAAMRGEVSLGTFMAFAQMSAGFLAAVLGLASTAGLVLVLRPHLARTAELGRTAREPQRPPGARGRAAGGIVLDSVWFRYDPDAPWVFSGYELHVDEGEKRWIQGPSGWGKSTLLRLVCGLYVPEQGRITVCGRDAVGSRSSILYLPQFVHLYAGSILDNLKLLSGDAARKRILEAAEASGLHEFVRRLPMGYETVVPPGAGSLSGGQRQLIALTAAMASERSVLLLDEAFANLDWLSRSWLADSPWFANRTVIHASHDTRIGS